MTTTRIHVSRMEEALIQERPDPWCMSLLKLYACISVGYLCSATNGFDANNFGMGTTTKAPLRSFLRASRRALQG